MKENKNDGWPEHYHILLPERLCRLGHFLTDQFRHKGLSGHFQDHPFDNELYGELEESDEGIDSALLNMNQIVDEAWEP